jgi:hypothetical protein
VKFLRVPLSEAAGGVLAHNIFDFEGRRVLKKGVVLAAADITQISALGRDFVYVAQWKPAT